MFSDPNVKRVRDELLLDASGNYNPETYEDYEDPPTFPPVPKRQFGTTGLQLRNPWSTDDVSILDQPPFRGDLSIVYNWQADDTLGDPDALNWTTQAEHDDIVRTYQEAQSKNPGVVLPVPITRQRGELRPCTAPYPVNQGPTTTHWCDDTN